MFHIVKSLLRVAKHSNTYKNASRWYGAFSEAWRPGQSFDYRVYRFKEAFSLLKDEDQ